jgi:hypothetical protein
MGEKNNQESCIVYQNQIGGKMYCIIFCGDSLCMIWDQLNVMDAARLGVPSMFCARVPHVHAVLRHVLKYYH